MRLHRCKGKGSAEFGLFAENAPLEKANQYLKALQIRGHSPHTIRAYGYDLLAFYRWLKNAEKEVAGLSAHDLLFFTEAQRQAGLRPRSINRRLTTIQAFCRFCNEAPVIAKGAPYSSAHYQGRGRDHFLGLHPLRPPKHRLLQVRIPQTLVEPLTTEQVRLFLQTLSRYRDLCIVYLMLFCGLRSNEVLGLAMTDISVEQMQLRVRGKGNKERMLPLPALVLNTMKKYLAFERPGKYPSQYFFLVLQGPRKGQPMTAAGLRTLFRYRRQKPKLTNANAHRWRHTFGTDMARAGSSLPVVQRLMGHSDMRVTLQYINLSMSDIAQEFARASAAIQQRYRR
jgi:site-specific recombinase XerD